MKEDTLNHPSSLEMTLSNDSKPFNLTVSDWVVVKSRNRSMRGIERCGIWRIEDFLGMDTPYLLEGYGVLM
uniref:Uncharacterized protein n=1 Tax=Tanacetum cinerariifolium TaxID=118510 RepID=A0A6L2L7X7_TANCI|nr:hypothetical protein [Tanacetum cinerariifolium]